MRNAGLEETQAGIKIAGRNVNNLRYANDTTFIAENEEELKCLLMKVKEESEKVGLKLILHTRGRVGSRRFFQWGSRFNRTWLPFCFVQVASEPIGGTDLKPESSRDDALHATRAAVEEGIVPGGGARHISERNCVFMS